MFIFVLAAAAVSSPAAVAAISSASSGMFEQAFHGEASLPIHAVPHAPDGPAQCADYHHPCGPGAIATAHAEPFVLGLTRHVSVVTPRGPQQTPVPDVAPHPAASVSILFRNFRE
jgi:hypothetical protein